MTAFDIRNEIWKPVVGFEGLYEVSNFGRVKSLDRVTRHNYGGFRNWKGRILRQKDTPAGYKRVALFKGMIKNKFVHRLMFEAFVGDVKFGCVIDHVNRDRSDNRLVNIRQVTFRENSTNRCREKLTSIHMGVHWSKFHNKWCSSIYAEGKYCHLGYYADELEASEAYQKALELINPHKKTINVGI